MSNKSRKSIKVLPVVTALAALFLAVGVMTIFPACGPKEDGTWMNCHYAQLTAFGLALVMTALSTAAIFAGHKAAQVLYILNIACALLTAVLPGTAIHLCMMNEMQCRAVMRPSVILVSAIVIALSLVSLLTGRESLRRTKR